MFYIKMKSFADKLLFAVVCVSIARASVIVTDIPSGTEVTTTTAIISKLTTSDQTNAANIDGVTSTKSGNTVEAKDGNNLRLVNVAPETELGSDATQSDTPRGCNVKNGTCVPTRDELNASGIENVDIVQHKIEDPVQSNNIPKENIADRTDGASGIPNGCNVKNGTCVPTRDELNATGIENVDIMQHKIEDPVPLDNIPKEKIEDRTDGASGIPNGCNVKNGTCVPTRDELNAAGIENLDIMQHKIDGPVPLDNIPKETLADRTDGASGIPNGCNVKNGTCVPTKDELIAAGVEHVDIMQHKLTLEPVDSVPLDNIPKEKVGDRTDGASGIPNGCNVKNSTCVPTRDELIAAGVENVDRMQHKIEDPIPLDNIPKEKVADRTDGASGIPKGCNVKNSTCVPTRDELITAGVENVPIMQHKLTLEPVDIPQKESTAALKVTDQGTTVDNQKPGCNVTNGTCVPSESELLAAGVNTSKFVGQLSLDNENLFLGQVKKSDKELSVEDTVGQVISTADRTTKAVSTSTIANVMGNEVVNGQTQEDELTKEMKPDTIQQVPPPEKTTQETALSSESTGTAGSESTTSKSEIKATSPIQQRVGTDQTTAANKQSTSEQTTSVDVFQSCPSITCQRTCRYGRKVNSDGCETCDCKFSDNCPRVIPASRLLCLLQVRTGQSCSSNADCRRNRICCPGTCGPTCRRPSRNRSMLLSMLMD